MSPAKILIVDDDAIIARLIEVLLEDLGYTVIAKAASGNEALKRAAETQPDLVLMDIQLPGGMDGIETAVCLQAKYNIPVIYLSAHCSDDILERAKITDPFGYVLKPIKEKELHAAIEIALRKHQLEEQIRRSNDELERRVEDRTLALQESNQALQASMETLHHTLMQLAQSEKMAALGGLVAGMTHEMSSPLGIAIMAVSHLEEITQKMQHEFFANQLSRTSLEKFLKSSSESVAIIQKKSRPDGGFAEKFQADGDRPGE